MIFEGVYRRFVPLKGGKAPLDVRLTHLESQAVGQVEPQGYELTRAGRRFGIAWTGTIPTAIAPVQAFPTTAAQWVIANLDTGGKSYVFKSIGAMLFSGTSGLGGTLLACFFTAPAAVAGFATGVSVQSKSNSAIGSKAGVRSGITITSPALPNWFPVADATSAVAQVGPTNAIVNRGLDGRVILPPGVCLGLAVLAPAGTTPLYLPMAEWVEIESDLE